MIRFLFALIFLAGAENLSGDSDAVYRKARIEDSAEHFNLVMENLKLTLGLPSSSVEAIADVSKAAVAKENGQRDAFNDGIERMVKERQLQSTAAKSVKKTWEQSFGYIFAPKSLSYDPRRRETESKAKKNNPYEMKKFRAGVYEQTKAACFNGYYLSPPQQAQLMHLSSEAIQRQQEESFVVHKMERLTQPGKYDKTEIRVTNEDTVDCAHQLLEAGYNPVALNFANKKNAGGGVVRGSQAQEEAIFRRSSYFLGLDIKYNLSLGAKMGGKYRIPEFGAVYTPHVQIIRGSESEGFPFIKPYAVDFIASAAYNLKDRWDTPCSGKAYLDGMKEKIRTILRLSAVTGHDAVVLGAFGCGAFNNNPKIVAMLFDEVLHESEFRGQFRLVIFAILDNRDDGNLQVFRRVLGGTA